MKKRNQLYRSFRAMSAATPFAFREAYKSLRTNLNFVSLNNQYKTIGITSAVPGEGKSSVAIHLATSLAEAGHKVLLADCDLRRPRIHKYLKIDNENLGITTVLSGQSQLSESIFTMSDLKIDVLCAGMIPPNPVELLGSTVMNQLIETLKNVYDYILFDTPPVSVVTDSAELSRLLDGMLLVVRQNYAKIDLIQNAKKNLESVNANIIGTVLNGFQAKNSSKNQGYYYLYGGYGYGEYSEKHRSGQSE